LKKKPAKAQAKPAAKATTANKAKASAKPVKAKKPAPQKSAPAPKKAAPSPALKIAKTPPVTAKKTPAEKNKPEAPKTEKAVAPAPAAPASVASAPAPAKAKTPRTTLDDLTLDVDEKDELLEEEKRDLAKALSQEDDEPLETAFVPTDTSERFILVVDEEGQRRNETVTIVQQILPNAVVEVADDPEEALEVMQEADFDTYVVNFLMPGFSASAFVKSVANHPDHPLLIGFAADKISDALDQRKGLKIIPLKRLFDLDVNAAAEPPKEKLGGLLED
jgi:CheY-like chemotaxis protein